MIQNNLEIRQKAKEKGGITLGSGRHIKNK